MNTQQSLVTLTIANVPVRQDAEGRYCLNDLHKASGGEDKHSPRRWLKNDRTEQLIYELTTDENSSLEQNQPVKVVNGGDGWKGTFGCLDLVYDYAMWISPAFQLQVTRSYHQLMTQRHSQKTDFLSFAQTHLLKAYPRLGKVLKLKQAGFSHCEIARFLRCGETTVGRAAAILAQCGFFATGTAVAGGLQ